MRQIVIEAETPDDSRTMFRLRLDETLVGECLTSAQAQIGVGVILEEIITTGQPSFPDPWLYFDEPPPSADNFGPLPPSAHIFGPLLLAWGFVGIPLLWGVYSTLVSAAKLFE
jgi:hypothetical protein